MGNLGSQKLGGQFRLLLELLAGSARLGQVSYTPMIHRYSLLHEQETEWMVRHQLLGAQG